VRSVLNDRKDLGSADGRGRGAILKVVLFHVCTEVVADAILDSGFVDGKGRYGTNEIHRGVWLSDRPLDDNEGASGNIVLQVSFPPKINLADYEWVEEGKGYREWLVPADIINSEAKVNGFPS
jgi:hypothetical protein